METQRALLGAGGEVTISLTVGPRPKGPGATKGGVQDRVRGETLARVAGKILVVMGELASEIRGGVVMRRGRGWPGRLL